MIIGMNKTEINCITQNEIIDSVLNLYKTELGKDYEQYKNHVYRVFNLSVPYILSNKNITNLAITCAFHDIGIWTNNTFDYLSPSIKLAKKYCVDNNLDFRTIDDIEIMISKHHKLTKIKNNDLAEIFRISDLVDLTWGFIRKGRSKQDIKMLKKTFPNKGFHLNLTKLFFKNLFINPLNPLPMYKI